MKLKKELESYVNYTKERHLIETDKNLQRVQRKKKLRALSKPSNNSITALSIWWGRDGWFVDSFTSDKLADIAIGKIRGFEKKYVPNFPEFKNPTINFDVGEYLCKLGFPFYKIVPKFDEVKKVFQLPPNTLPIPLFPIEGMFARTHLVKQKKLSAEFVETSSPGLRGQSGGPTFDTEGRIWAMQSRTIHYPLGFSPAAPNQRNKEHQFLNCGLGTHSNTIINFFKHSKVNFSMSKD